MSKVSFTDNTPGCFLNLVWYTDTNKVSVLQEDTNGAGVYTDTTYDELPPHLKVKLAQNVKHPDEFPNGSNWMEIYPDYAYKHIVTGEDRTVD